MKALLDLLQHYQLPYQIHEHEPVFTVEECQHLYEKMPGAHCKTLFLKDRKKALFLVSLLNHKKADLKALSKILGNGHLSFCSPQELDEKLKLIPGAVTPYALLHDTHGEITFVLDRDLLQCEIINFHPLRNDRTLAMPMIGFMKFFEWIHHSPMILDIPIRSNSSN